MINWKQVTDETRDAAVRLLVTRGREIFHGKAAGHQLLDREMDLCAVHTWSVPLDFERMMTANKADLLHDMTGIQKYIDRDRGVLTEGFVPRLRLRTKPAAKPRAKPSRTKREPYSVMLRYPEYVTDGQPETFYTFVKAASPADAVHKARKQAVRKMNKTGAYTPEELEKLYSEFEVELVIRGRHKGLEWEG